MYNSGDAAEQVVRMSLEGAEFALKITGSAAKNLAAALYTVLKDQKKTKGKARIETMLREKRPLKVYTIKKEDCPEFARQAKGYGILYAPIPVKKGDNTIDILVFQDDAARANRIVEKFNLTVVDTASIKEDIEKSVREAEQFAAEDKKRREEVDTKNNAENLCYTAEKLVSDSGDKMQDSDKNEINTKVAALRETLKNGTVEQIKAGMDELQKAVYAASEKLYQQQAPQGGQPGQQPPYQGGNPGDNGGNNGGDGNVYDADYKEVD